MSIASPETGFELRSLVSPDSTLELSLLEVPIAAPEAVPKPLAEDEAPVLPPVEELTIDSDFRGFFHPKVDEDLRRSALRKLFSDPHFNVMDGLDTYIDDYSISEPIPPAMLAGLKQAQRILQWAEGRDDPPEETVEGRPPDEPASEAGAGPAAAAAPEASAIEAEKPADEPVDIAACVPSAEPVAKPS